MYKFAERIHLDEADLFHGIIDLCRRQLAQDDGDPLEQTYRCFVTDTELVHGLHYLYESAKVLVHVPATRSTDTLQRIRRRARQLWLL